MGLERILSLFIFYRGLFVLGIVIDPQRPGSDSTVHVHCLTSNELIQIKDPFSSTQSNDGKLIAVEWYQYQTNRTNELRLLEFLKDKPPAQIQGPKFSVFEVWGLQINDVRVTDSGEYKAIYVHQAQNREKWIQIVVARPPVLGSDKLTVNRKVNQFDKSVILSCGQISDQGSPPISILLKAENGTVLPAVYSNGVVELVVSSKEAETLKFSCGINMSEPAATCIDSKDLSRWQGVVTEAAKSQGASSETIGIISGVVAAVVFVIAIIIIIILIVLRRRKMKTKTYNTQEHEQKRGEPQGNTESLLRDYENPYDRPYVGTKPIYKGPPEPGPYMVSRISQGVADPDSEYEPIECANGDKSKPNQSSGLFIKRGDEKDRKKQEKDVQRENNNEKEKMKEKIEKRPPQAKPRSIFLTPSMEELDKIGKAVAGGEGSQPGVGRGTQV